MGNVLLKDVTCERKLFAEPLSDGGWQIQTCKAEVSALTLHLSVGADTEMLTLNTK